LGIEIERKFLLQDESWRSQSECRIRMAQGYLNDLRAVESGQQQCSVRIRIADGRGFLNLKSRELGRSRQEFEYEVPLVDAEALLKLCTGGVIDKHRHHVRHAGHLWEIDEFLGDNAGLVVAEIELASPDEVFARPAWIGAEVTQLQRYYNLALSGRPYSVWNEAEKSSMERPSCS
jgi:adenylate cyclase